MAGTEARRKSFSQEFAPSSFFGMNHFLQGQLLCARVGGHHSCSEGEPSPMAAASWFPLHRALLDQLSKEGSRMPNSHTLLQACRCLGHLMVGSVPGRSVPSGLHCYTDTIHRASFRSCGSNTEPMQSSPMWGPRLTLQLCHCQLIQRGEFQANQTEGQAVGRAMLHSTCSFHETWEWKIPCWSISCSKRSWLWLQALGLLPQCGGPQGTGPSLAKLVSPDYILTAQSYALLRSKFHYVHWSVRPRKCV